MYHTVLPTFWRGVWFFLDLWMDEIRWLLFILGYHKSSSSSTIACADWQRHNTSSRQKKKKTQHKWSRMSPISSLAHSFLISLHLKNRCAPSSSSLRKHTHRVLHLRPLLLILLIIGKLFCANLHTNCCTFGRQGSFQIAFQNWALSVSADVWMLVARPGFSRTVYMPISHRTDLFRHNARHRNPQILLQLGFAKIAVASLKRPSGQLKKLS
jgi:hypothetical protein